MCSKAIVFCFSFILLCFLCECYGLKNGDKGVCEHLVSSIITKKVYYTKLNKLRRCKGKPCVVRYAKIEKVNQKKKQLLCCSGWQYDASSDSCKPVCSTGCLNGTCTAPSLCQCNPPLYLEPTRKNICLPPRCEPPCINSECTAPNECTCATGYLKRDDETNVCVNLKTELPASKCKVGYLNVDDVCEPICSKGCVNGECAAPDTCVCFKGYTKNESNPEVCRRDCLPQCGGNCDVDGQCPEIACEPVM